MLLVGTNIDQAKLLSEKYKEKFNYIVFNNTNSSNDNYIVHFIELIKESVLKFDITFVQFNDIIIKILNTLNINYSVICNEEEELQFINENVTKYIIKDNSFEKTLKPYFNWVEVKEESLSIPENKNKLTFEQLLNEDVSITEADVRSLKETQNKLKVGMLLQAKNSLNRILKLTKVLDKLYDELVDRIDMDLNTTDTASLMYTADYISKALQDTNKLIVDLISNDKIQNFFIIDNSQTLNIGDEKVKIAIVGKYVRLEDSYISVIESIRHAGFANNVNVEIELINSETVNKDNVAEKLKGVQGVVVPGGFGNRGIEGKIETIRYVRENKIPFLGICLGMQMAVVEFARNVLGYNDANSAEFDDKAEHPVIHIMEDQKYIDKMGGTMRLGAYPCSIKKDTLAYNIYGEENISERHRHRFEYNNKYKEELEAKGLICSGVSPDGLLVEIVEIKEHPYFIAGQFHPELKSRPNRPAPLFVGLVKAAKEIR